MGKHTQAEWQRVGTTVYALNEQGTNIFSAHVQANCREVTAEELEANAVLMKAAPRLLESLHDLLELLEVDDESQTPGTHSYAACEIARLVIQDATGETP